MLKTLNKRFNVNNVKNVLTFGVEKSRNTLKLQDCCYGCLDYKLLTEDCESKQKCFLWT